MQSRPVCRYLLLVPSLLLLIGCTRLGYVKDPTPWVATADWNDAQQTRLDLSDIALDPQVLQLTEGVAYALRLQNRDNVPRRLDPDGLFRSVATRELATASGMRVSAPYFNDLVLSPRQVLTWSFVAVRPGTYEVRSSRTDGTGLVLGAIEIQPHTPPASAPSAGATSPKATPPAE